MLVVVARSLELRQPSRGGARRSRRFNLILSSPPDLFGVAPQRTLKRAEARAPLPGGTSRLKILMAAVFAFSIFNFSFAASAATRNRNRIENNHVTAYENGVVVSGTGNFIFRNTTGNVGTNYIIAAGNAFGPINSGIGVVTNHPWANFSQ